MATPVWGNWVADGSRFEIIWPVGFALRSSPVPEVVDPSGKVVGTDGQEIDDAGGSGPDPMVICTIAGTTYPLTIVQH